MHNRFESSKASPTKLGAWKPNQPLILLSDFELGQTVPCLPREAAQTEPIFSPGEAALLASGSLGAIGLLVAAFMRYRKWKKRTTKVYATFFTHHQEHGKNAARSLHNAFQTHRRCRRTVTCDERRHFLDVPTYLGQCPKKA